MIEVVEFNPEHLEQISPKACHFGEVPKIVLTHAVTMLQDQKPIGIFGCFMFIPGVIHVWAYLSEEVRKTPISFHKECRKLFRFYSEKYRPLRLQIDVRADYPEGIKWAESLGFQKEGIMKNFGAQGVDSWLMGRAFKWEQ